MWIRVGDSTKLFRLHKSSLTGEMISETIQNSGVPIRVLKDLLDLGRWNSFKFELIYLHHLSFSTWLKRSSEWYLLLLPIPNIPISLSNSFSKDWYGKKNRWLEQSNLASIAPTTVVGFAYLSIMTTQEFILISLN